jgi:hypothetical protein
MYMVGVMTILLASACVQAKLQLVENFDSLTGAPDGQACKGALGGFLDTQSEATGNSALGTINGSNAMNVIGNTGGSPRAVGVGGINNPIENSETGIGFFRIMVRATALAPRSFVGLIANATDNPINSANTSTPTNIPAGFGLIDNGAAGLNVTKTDASTILKAGLKRGQWYNVWIVANNITDTFDLYMSEAPGPAGEATLPTPDDLVAGNIPFSVATTEPLNGVIVANPTGTAGQVERIYIDEIWWDGDQGLETPTKARKPIPASGTTDVPRDGVLIWTPGQYAVAHDVYFGKNRDEVSSAGAASPLLVSRGQAASIYGPGRLDFAQMYFWRVDEVNAPPSSTIFKGDVWSFTVEPVAIAIGGDRIVATASSEAPDQGPAKTVDGSGLVNGLHSIALNDMWLSSDTDTGPVWIRYDFDKAYKLHEMLVWNYNGPSLLSMIGLKDVVVEYSSDGVQWTQIAGVPPFVQASGKDGYASGTTVAFNGVAATSVKITAGSNWSNGIFKQYGLSEVRFMVIPVSAREPEPGSAASGVTIDTTLTWRAGREAGQHKVYLSADEQAVIAGTAPVATAAAASHGPLSLDLDSTYYWRVDEVNGVDTWRGDIWSFTTQAYRVVDDFESYNDIDPPDPQSHRIFETWTDGYGTTTNGALVGNELPPYAESRPGRTHGGRQSVPVVYNNTVASLSEVTVNTSKLAIGADWSKGATQRLSLWFYGDPNNAAERMYVKVNGVKAIYEGNLTTATWQEWVIDLTALGVNLSNVTTLAIGFERAGAAGGTGKVLLDDIRLYPPPPAVPLAALTGATVKNSVNFGGKPCPQNFLM